MMIRAALFSASMLGAAVLLDRRERIVFRTEPVAGVGSPKEKHGDLVRRMMNYVDQDPMMEKKNPKCDPDALFRLTALRTRLIQEAEHSGRIKEADVLDRVHAITNTVERLTKACR